MQHLVLGELGLVEVARLGDRRLLRVGHRPRLDARVRVLLLQALHRELERGLQLFVFCHHALRLFAFNQAA